MAQHRRHVKRTATFEERLAEEAIKFKEAAEKHLPAALPENYFCDAPGRPKRHHTSATGLALPDYSRPRHSKLCFPIKGSNTWLGGCFWEAFDGRMARLCHWVG